MFLKMLQNKTPLAASLGQSVALQVLPVRVAVGTTDLVWRAVFEFQNRMNLPVVFANECSIQKMMRIEHQIPGHSHQKRLTELTAFPTCLDRPRATDERQQLLASKVWVI